MICQDCKRRMRRSHRASVRKTQFIVWACRCGNHSLERKVLSLR